MVVQVADFRGAAGALAYLFQNYRIKTGNGDEFSFL